MGVVTSATTTSAAGASGCCATSAGPASQQDESARVAVSLAASLAASPLGVTGPLQAINALVPTSASARAKSKKCGVEDIPRSVLRIGRTLANPTDPADSKTRRGRAEARRVVSEIESALVEHLASSCAATSLRDYAASSGGASGPPRGGPHDHRAVLVQVQIVGGAPDHKQVCPTIGHDVPVAGGLAGHGYSTSATETSAVCASNGCTTSVGPASQQDASARNTVSLAASLSATLIGVTTLPQPARALVPTSASARAKTKKCGVEDIPRSVLRMGRTLRITGRIHHAPTGFTRAPPSVVMACCV